jgi:hypothetical protein
MGDLKSRSQRAKDALRQPLPLPRERREEASPGGGVALAKRRRQCGERGLEDCRARGSVPKKGDPAASGWIAEQTSWRNPGSVCSFVRDPPPTVAAGRIPPISRLTRLVQYTLAPGRAPCPPSMRGA